MRLSSRPDFLKAILCASLQASPLASTAAHAATFLQADDKSFDITLPEALWTKSPPLRGTPPNLFSLVSKRDGSSTSVTVTVELAKADQWGLKFPPKTLADLGNVESVGERLRLEQPQPAVLTRAAKVAGAGLFATSTYDFRFEHAGGQSLIRLALKQGRVYRLALALPAQPDETLLTEAEGIVSSFRAYPLNAGCLASSNNGRKALPGVCY
jgi:hypothetical protein